MAEEASGITRIVGGEMINTSTGMKLSATEGNFEMHAAQKIQMTGEENGLIYGDYKADHKDDILDKTVTVKLNLFFDGTQNNKTNIESRDVNNKNHKDYQAKGNKNDDSYENDYTNIARAFDAIDPDAENQVATYIEGAGTENLKTDSVFLGVAQGKGNTGIEAKVSKGCLEAAIQIKKNGYTDKIIDVLNVNVYGFSRGAAQARHFIYVASKMANYKKNGHIGEGKYDYTVNADYRFSDSKYQLTLYLKDTSFIDKYGYFGACLLDQKLDVRKIVFNFVGVYDTVASHGLYHGNDVFDLKLDSVKKANYVFHLASDDEYRENFDLSNIKSAGIRGFELILPGVHSDIGGSYLDGVEEISVIDNITCNDEPEQRKMAKHLKDKEFEKFKKIVVDEGWFTDRQIEKRFFYEYEFDKISFFNKDQHNYGLVGTRMLHNTYDKIPLNLMIEKSKDFNVVYLDRKEKINKIEDVFILGIFNDLKHYYNAIRAVRNKYVEEFNKGDGKNFADLSQRFYAEIKLYHYSSYITPKDLKKLRNKYLHWSVKTNLIGYDARGGKEGAIVQEQRKREIHDA